MRLKRLKLINYGSFKDLDLEFAPEPGRLTVITAPNGWGKSVLRQAFRDLLFDIPVQSPMRFRHGYTGMAIHAEALDAEGVPLTFGWVRNGKPPRVTSDPARFEALRYGVTPVQFEQMFALDTDRLRKGGTNLKGATTLSAALLAGTGELASAKSVRAIIDRRRQDNWGSGKSKPPLNAAAARLDGARKRLRETVQQPEVRVREERELARRIEEQEDARKARDAAANEVRRLTRVELTRPHLEALSEANAWFQANPDAPALPLELGKSLAAAREQVALAGVEHDAAQQNLLSATEAVGRISRDLPCTAVADRLAKVSGMLGEAEKAASDTVERRREHATSTGLVRVILDSIGAAYFVGRVEEIIPTVGLKADLQAATKEGIGLHTTFEVSRAAVIKARAKLTQAETGTMVAEALPDGLTALLLEIRADRNPAAHAEEVQGKVEVAAAQVRRCLALVPGWPGTAEQLRDLVVKADGEFERLDSDLRNLTAIAAEKRAHRAGLAEQDRHERDALAALQRRDLPDTSSVAAARSERDRGMRLVLRRAFGQAPDPEEEHAYGGGEAVPLVYERHVRAADAIADRRVEELGQVQDAERLRSSIAAREAPLDQVVRDEEHAAREHAVAQAAWAAAVAPLGLNGAATLSELRHVTQARRALVDALLVSETAEATEEKLGRQHRIWADRLAAMLAGPAASLSSLLAQADQRVSAAQSAERANTRRQAAIDAAQRAVGEAGDSLAAAEAAMAGWGQRWERLLQQLHRPGSESPDAVTAVLEALDRLEAHHRDAISLAGRIADMGEDLERFATAVADLAAVVGQPASPTPFETARSLIQRHRAAAAAEAAWGQAQLALTCAEEAVHRAADKLRDAQATLAGVIASCGARDDLEAEARIVASRAHAEQVARRDTARKGLVAHGDGLTEDALRIEGEGVPPETMAGRRRAAEEAVTTAQSQSVATAIALKELQAKLDQASSATDALDARVDYEAASAEYSRSLEEQLVLHLASTMLGDAMQVVEEAVGGTTLARTSAAFSAVTDGDYGLELHDGPEGEELHAVECAYPNERKALEDLSEGTRDQLYLALRIQALREYCASANPLPFIADDILQTFDDDRARAALRALCGLSAELQVIVLTHHPHLQAIAASLGPDLVRYVDLTC